MYTLFIAFVAARFYFCEELYPLLQESSSGQKQQLLLNVKMFHTLASVFSNKHLQKKEVKCGANIINFKCFKHIYVTIV